MLKTIETASLFTFILFALGLIFTFAALATFGTWFGAISTLAAAFQYYQALKSFDADLDRRNYD